MVATNVTSPASKVTSRVNSSGIIDNDGICIAVVRIMFMDGFHQHRPDESGNACRGRDIVEAPVRGGFAYNLKLEFIVNCFNFEAVRYSVTL